MRAFLPLLALILLPACVGKKALESAELAVLQDPNQAEAWVMLGDTYRRAKMDDEAAAAYARALALEPDNEAIRRRTGSERSSAIREMERQVLAQPDNDELWGDLGDLYAEAGDRATAAQHYRYALSLDPDDGEWQRKVMEFSDEMDLEAMVASMANSNDDERIGDLADALMERGHSEQACELYFQALAIDPDDSEWIPKAGECPGGADIGDRVVETALRSEDDERIGDVADMLMERGDTERACELYVRALEIDPADSEWIRKVGDCPTGQVAVDRALERAIESGDDERIGDVGDIYMARGDRERACELYRRALSIDPDDSEWMGNVMECPGSEDMLETSYQTALTTRDDEAVGDIADMLAARGDQRACELYRRALSIDPDDSEWIEKVGQCDGDGLPNPTAGYDDMMPDLIGDMPGNGWGPSGDSLVALGRAALANGDRTTALQHFEAALLDSPNDRDARVGVMSLTGKSLVAVLEELTPARPEDDELWGDLADAYLEAGNASEALRAYRRAAEIDPDDSEWQRKLDLLDPARLGGQ